jgi:hypothetical protein
MAEVRTLNAEDLLDRSALIVALAVAAALGTVGGWAWVSRPPPSAGPLEYVEGPLAVGRHVVLGRRGILTSENFVGHRIRNIEGTLENIGDRTVGSVSLLLSFRGIEGGTVVESSEEALDAPLGPGESRRYVFRFENLPPDWDYRVPDVEVVRVGIAP